MRHKKKQPKMDNGAWEKHLLCNLETYALHSHHPLSVRSLSHVRLFASSWTAARQASLSITSSLELTQTHVHRVGDATQPFHPLSAPSSPAFKTRKHSSSRTFHILVKCLEKWCVCSAPHAIQPQLLVGGLEVSHLHVTLPKRSYLSPTLNGQHRIWTLEH